MSSCQCEDRPACGCYSIAELRGVYDYTDPGDLADRQRERMEQEDDNACSICGEEFTDEDDEDDEVQGFHAECENLDLGSDGDENGWVA